MKMLRLSETLSVCVLFLAQGLLAQASPPYARASVFIGGTFNTAVFVGAYDAQREFGEAPNLLISSCGASIASGLIRAVPDAAERKALLASEEFHRFLRASKIRGNPLPAAGKLAGILSSSGKSRTCPNIFDGTLYEVPEAFDSSRLRVGFSSDSSPCQLILASSTELGPHSIGLPLDGSKVFSEAYFTDAITAAGLQDFVSPIAQFFADSRVATRPEIRSNDTYSDAIRGSVTDPFLVNPMRLDGRYYFTGALNHYPVELAKHLADEVTIALPVRMPLLGEKAMDLVYGISLQARYDFMLQQEATRWIDLTNFNPEGSRRSVAFGDFKPGLSLESGVPASYVDFRSAVQAQYELGYQRALEALRLPKGTQAHLRNAPHRPARGR